MSDANDVGGRPDCDICGQPYHRHMEICGAGMMCPVSAVSYRPKRAATLSPPASPLGVEGLREACRLPPKGWWCSRGAGHEGPCAARPINPVQTLCDALYQRFDDEPDFLGMEAAAWMQVAGEALQRIHRYALAAEGVGYDLILSVTDPLVGDDAALSALPLSGDPI